MTDTPSPKLSIPSISEFCLQVPLYKAYALDKLLINKLHHLISAADNLDCYCVGCAKTSVFNGEANTTIAPAHNFFISDQIFVKRFKCSRNQSHLLLFFFQIKGMSICKIGQTPSHADLSMPELLKYRKVLDEEDYKEFHRGVGLSTHGIGIGAFVYLRRIFENLIDKAHTAVATQPGWDEDTYQRSRMSERIELLKGHLPEFLVQHKALYSILSKGIHELSEQDCLAAFPVMKLGIELILDEEIEKHKREAKLQEAAKEIALLTEKHK